MKFTITLVSPNPAATSPEDWEWAMQTLAPILPLSAPSGEAWKGVLRGREGQIVAHVSIRAEVGDDNNNTTHTH